MDEFRPVCPPFPETPDGDGYYLPVRDGEVLVRATSSSVTLCQSWPKGIERPPGFTLIGWLGQRPCLMAELPPGRLPRMAGHALRDLRSLHGLLTDGEFAAAGTALAVLHFLHTSVFCPRCGKQAERDPSCWLRRCPACGLEQEPRTHPTVMVLVHDRMQVLLTQPVGFSRDLFTLPAVVVGPGQGLEEALLHFVSQTLGVNIRGLTYFGSQPWPFPDRVVIGFHGRAEATRSVAFDRRHFVAARWFHIDDLPALPAPLSLARRMADWYAQLPRLQGYPTIPSS